LVWRTHRYSKTTMMAIQVHLSWCNQQLVSEFVTQYRFSIYYSWSDNWSLTTISLFPIFLDLRNNLKSSRSLLYECSISYSTLKRSFTPRIPTITSATSSIKFCPTERANSRFFLLCSLRSQKRTEEEEPTISGRILKPLNIKAYPYCSCMLPVLLCDV